MSRAKNAGLLLAYEKTGYDNTKTGRLPDLLDIWSVRRLVKAGADCIKILLYYTPFDPPDVNEIKHAWVERIGAECVASDVPFFLEFVGYEEGGDEKGIGFARKKPDVVTQSMAEFSKPQYGVDILKVEVPVNMAFVQGSKASKGEFAYTREEAKEHFRRSAAAAKKPFIYLSAGVSNEVFLETLDLAGEANTNFSGVLCGRATWKEGIPVYAKQGVKALEDWLKDEGVREHQERERAPEGRQALVQLLRRVLARRLSVTHTRLSSRASEAAPGEGAETYTRKGRSPERSNAKRRISLQRVEGSAFSLSARKGYFVGLMPRTNVRMPAIRIFPSGCKEALKPRIAGPDKRS